MELKFQNLSSNHNQFFWGGVMVVALLLSFCLSVFLFHGMFYI